MSTPTAQDAPALEDYAEFLSAVDAAGVGFAVIGGAAVGHCATKSEAEAVVGSSADQAERDQLTRLIAERFDP